MQHLEGSGMPVLYIGRTVLKGQGKQTKVKNIPCLSERSGLFVLFRFTSGCCLWLCCCSFQIHFWVLSLALLLHLGGGLFATK